MDRPMIVYLQGNHNGHYVVARPVGHSGSLVQILDGYHETAVLDLDQFVRSEVWTGLVLEPDRLDRLRLVTFAGGLAVVSLPIVTALQRAIRRRTQPTPACVSTERVVP